MSYSIFRWRFVGLIGWFWAVLGVRSEGGAELWELARSQVSVHRISTLFTAHDVRRYLGSEAGMDQALGWCRTNGVTKVYLESFRDGREVEVALLEAARNRFRSEGFAVAGCVTTTDVGKKSNRWNIIGCYTDRATQDRVQEIFECAAAVFDEVMIDDFWFTECSCRECDAARSARLVTVGTRATPAAGETWEDYRRELMVRLSRERVIEPVRRVNPRCQLILKFPQWYEAFQERGYDVIEGTRLFDRTWVGTETRDYDDKQWGGTVQYEGYFLMRWLAGIGGEKCGGGWFDSLGTTERTYVEQARQTVLGGARESLLFCFGGLQGGVGPRDLEAFRAELPALLEVAGEVRRRPCVGVAAYKPPHSTAEGEKKVFDFVGMLGVPLMPVHQFPAEAKAAFFSLHALKDPGFVAGLRGLVEKGVPVLLTDGLAARLPKENWWQRESVRVLPVRGDPKALLGLSADELEEIRGPLLKPFGRTFRAPSRVSLALFADGSRVVQNFNATPVAVESDGATVTLPGRGWVVTWK